MNKNDLKNTAQAIIEKTATPEELIDFNYRTLLAECAGLSFRADHCNLDLMPEKQVRDILKRVRDISRRKDVRANLCNQVRPEGSRRRP